MNEHLFQQKGYRASFLHWHPLEGLRPSGISVLKVFAMLLHLWASGHGKEVFGAEHWLRCFCLCVQDVTLNGHDGFSGFQHLLSHFYPAGLVRSSQGSLLMCAWFGVGLQNIQNSELYHGLLFCKGSDQSL